MKGLTLTTKEQDDAKASAAAQVDVPLPPPMSSADWIVMSGETHFNWFIVAREDARAVRVDRIPRLHTGADAFLH